MKAAYIRAHGPASAIEYGDLPMPEPGPHDVLVKVEATDVNHVDRFVRSGDYVTATPFPFVIGRDLVGTVVESGGGFAVGDRVWCNSMGHAGRQGAFSEYVAVPSERLYHLPDGLEAAQSVVVLHPGGTAYLGLFRDAHLARRDTVFIGGAGGAVGSAAVQMAAHAGARVIVSAAPEDFEWCFECGADEVVDFRRPDAYAAIHDLAREGFDIWWDTSGFGPIAEGLRQLKMRGRLVLTAGLKAPTEFVAGEFYTRDLQMLGFAISNASVADLADAAAVINELLGEGVLSGRIGTVLSLSEGRQAHELMEAGGSPGRIVVVPDHTD